MKTEREDLRNLGFSESDLKPFASNENVSISKKEATSNVADKFENIDTRLQQFADDVAFIYNLAINQGNEFFRILLENEEFQIDERDDVGDWDTWYIPPNKNNEFGFNFGIGLAQIARPFLEMNERLSVDSLVWGFLVGLISDSADNVDVEIETIQDVIDFIEKKKEDREVVGREKSMNAWKVESTALENLGYVSTGSLMIMALKLIEETREGGIPNSVSEFEDVFEDLEEKFISETEYGEIMELEEDLLEDVEYLQDQGWNNIHRMDVLNSIISSEGKKIGTETIKEGVDARKPAVKKILNDFSGRGQDTVGPNWADPPLIEKTGGRSEEWKLTTYGELVAYLFVEAQKDPEETVDQYDVCVPLHRYASNDFSCSDRASELINKTIEEYY